MQFPQRDLTNQYISTSYQDVVQRYLSGSIDYLLDGFGFSILGVPANLKSKKSKAQREIDRRLLYQETDRVR